MKTLKQQRGVSYLGGLIILALVAFAGLFAAKVGPLFMENSAVNTAMEYLIGTPNLGKKGKKGIIDTLDKQLYIDGVESFKAKELKIVKSKTSKAWLVTADYEARVNLVSNVDVIAHFTKTVEVPR
ncbi:MAG: DUF4845 domain-containing protein [Gammaproteobacteria bacterium]|nr:DUF4845 domain-containing protein [Gammaproteobacteria bacterium]